MHTVAPGHARVRLQRSKSQAVAAVVGRNSRALGEHGEKMAPN